jgi:hypothetical protein
VLVRTPVAISQRLRIGFDLKQTPGNFSPVAVVEPGQFGQDLRLAQGLISPSIHPYRKPSHCLAPDPIGRLEEPSI